MYQYLTMAAPFSPSLDEDLWAVSSTCSPELKENNTLGCHGGQVIATDLVFTVLLPF